jgi:iron complex outermembrane receptor protein
MLGSGSALYGSDASGGVINIITSPPEGWEVRLRTAAGNDGVNQQRVSLADAFGSLSEQLSFSRDFSSGFRPDRDYRNLQFASSTRLLTPLGYGNLTLAYMDHPFGADQFYGPYPSWEDTKTWWFGFTQALGKKTSFNFAYRRHSDLFVLVRDDPALYTNHHHDQDFQSSIRRSDPLGANTTLSYGIEAIHESIVSNNLGNHARSRGAAYIALDFRALKRFSLSLAAREEAYRDFSAEFSPSISGGAWLTRRIKLRASVSRAFRIPTYTDLYYSDPANQGNPHLLPEHASSATASTITWPPAAACTRRSTSTVSTSPAWSRPCIWLFPVPRLSTSGIPGCSASRTPCLSASPSTPSTTPAIPECWPGRPVCQAVLWPAPASAS